ncbi:hypothetical protein M011DRAFT_298086 [Sporormia fimetaria CBS 119925]|uniref:Uncharacterized protein n=1 Tax=Sporormia fimetaria CBS 119925 TaxID=1340428 RepID=A0A6A6UVA4_9PLEO|nr:hypothetical protein M011DRAFT_298086 [Sporormia fimetaria CBS 119925]
MSSEVSLRQGEIELSCIARCFCLGYMSLRLSTFFTHLVFAGALGVMLGWCVSE